MIKTRLKRFLFQKNKRKLTKREISRFCGQLKMLLASGVPLLEAFQIITNITPRQEYEVAIQKISEGESLAIALKDYFPPIVVSSLQGAEKVGDLEAVLARLNIYYEKRAEVEDTVKSALVYPAFVICLCMLSFIVLIVFVLPGFKDLFADFNTEIPLFTQIIMGTGEIVSKIWYLPILFAAIAGIFLKGYRKTAKGALVIDRMVFKIASLRRDLMVQAFRTLGSLLRGGVPILSALTTTINSTTNRAFQEIILEIKENIENGERLSEILKRYQIFPKESIQMIAVGENSGKLDEMLINISNFYEKEKELFIKKFTTLLEPIMTLIVGVVVGIVALAMFLPMMNMISSIQ